MPKEELDKLRDLADEKKTKYNKARFILNINLTKLYLHQPKLGFIFIENQFLIEK